VFHLDEGLELLDDAAFRCENVVLHVDFAQEVSLVFQVADDLDLVAAFSAAFNSVIKNAAVKPCSVVENDFCALLLVVD
jgi:hypothetical protein